MSLFLHQVLRRKEGQRLLTPASHAPAENREIHREFDCRSGYWFHWKDNFKSRDRRPQVGACLVSAQQKSLQLFSGNEGHRRAFAHHETQDASGGQLLMPVSGGGTAFGGEWEERRVSGLDSRSTSKCPPPRVCRALGVFSL